MFNEAHDETQRLWFALIGGTHLKDEDYQGVVGVWDRIARLSPRSGDPSVFILEVLAGSATPPAIWRRKFAEAESPSHGKRVAFSLVSSSALVRSIRTAVTWIAPPPPGFETTSAATIEAALQWVESHRPGVSLALRNLSSDARAMLHEAPETTLK